MLEFDRLTTALAFSLVHVLTVVYLNTMNIRRSKLIYSKLLSYHLLLFSSQNFYTKTLHILSCNVIFIATVYLLYLQA